MKAILIFIQLTICFVSVQSQNTDYLLRAEKYKVAPTSVCVSPDGKWILTGFDDGSVRVSDSQSFEEIFSIIEEGRPAVYDIEMTPKMDVIFVAAGNKIYLYDANGSPIGTWIHHRTTIWSMDIDPKGEYVVSAEANKTFQIWNVFQGEIEESMRGHEEPTLAVSFSPDGKYIASGSNDTEVHLWDLESRSVIVDFHGHSDDIYDIKFSPDGNYLAACSKDKTVRIWNIEEEKLVHLLKGHTSMVFEIEFSPDGKYLLSASADFGIKLWDLESGEQLYAYLENKGMIIDIEFMPDGKSFLSVSMDNQLKEWQIHPEIFVMKYYQEEFENEMEGNPLFLPRQSGEKKSDYEQRQIEAQAVRKEMINSYYQKYLIQQK